MNDMNDQKEQSVENLQDLHDLDDDLEGIQPSDIGGCMGREARELLVAEGLVED